VQTTEADAVLDLEQLRNLTLDERRLMREILWALIDETSRQMPLLEAAIRDCDAQRSIRLARGSLRACANVGANAAAAALKTVLNSAAHGQFPQCSDAMGRLRSEIQRLRAETERL
jgi:HPt (histidine-containing phosphotransfer) domain-containing protein